MDVWVTFLTDAIASLTISLVILCREVEGTPLPVDGPLRVDGPAVDREWTLLMIVGTLILGSLFPCLQTKSLDYIAVYNQRECCREYLSFIQQRKFLVKQLGEMHCCYGWLASISLSSFFISHLPWASSAVCVCWFGMGGEHYITVMVRYSNNNKPPELRDEEGWDIPALARADDSIDDVICCRGAGPLDAPDDLDDWMRSSFAAISSAWATNYIGWLW